MGKSKKGKKKGKNLSEEEKAKQAEMKALAEKEKLVRRKRLTKAFLKLKREKEYELIKVNDAKMLDIWRPRLRKLKMEEIMDDYKMMKAAFERNNQKKDELIADLENSMSRNETEYDNAFDMHLNNLDELLDFYRKRLQEVRDLYAMEKGKVLGVLNEEKSQIQEFQDKSIRHLAGVTNGVNAKYKELAADSKNELFLRQEEMKNKSAEEIHATKVATDQWMKQTWNEMQKLLIDYDNKITPMRDEYRKLREKDDKTVGEINKQFQKMYKLQVGVETLSGKDKAYTITLESLVSDLLSKRDILKAKYNLEQDRFNRITKLGQSSIRTLVLISGSVLEKLDEMLEQRKRLMRVIERCRRCERMEEKIDPFLKRWDLVDLDENNSFDLESEPAPEQLEATKSIYVTPEEELELQNQESFIFTPKHMEHILTCDCNPCTCSMGHKKAEDDDSPTKLPTFSAEKIVEDYAFLEKFWTRYNKVSLELRALQEKKKALIQDNHGLRSALANYMGGLVNQPVRELGCIAAL